jgi:hypothetical protein
MSQRSLFEDSTSSSLTLPRWGSMRNGVLWERTMPELPTSASGSSSWPTPTGGDAVQSANETSSCATEGHHSGTTLTDVMRKWPTPRADPAHKGGNLTLPGATQKWATPTTRDWKDGADLSDAVPTNALLGRQVLRTQWDGTATSKIGRVLNPLFVEALMGWPIGWSACGFLGMESSPSKQPSPSDSFLNVELG